MNVEVKSVEGASRGFVELNDAVFNIETSHGAIYHGIRNELANKRQGTVKTKGRAEVLYSGRKPWKQKGTGRARAGTRRSPIWVGGGTIFGPQPRDYSYTLPKKMKRLAFRSVLTEKLREKQIEIIDDIKVESGKTKDFYFILKQLDPSLTRSLVIVGNNDNNELLKRAAKNVSYTRVYSYERLLLKDLFYAKKIFITQAAAEALNVFLSDKKEQA